MPETVVEARVTVKKAARFPNPVVEIPEHAMDDKIKVGATAKLFKDGSKLILDFGEI